MRGTGKKGVGVGGGWLKGGEVLCCEEQGRRGWGWVGGG